MTAPDTEKSDLAGDAPHLADDAPHLLVVDDDERIRDLLGSYLRQNGFRVTQAENGAAARTQLEGLAFDCIILDVMMPGESGFEVAERLRKESDVPILMLTARSEPNTASRAWSLASTTTCRSRSSRASFCSGCKTF